MSEMKPCPFCGCTDNFITVTSNPFSNDIYSTTHCKCYATGPFIAENYLTGEKVPTREFMENKATERWNTRPIEDNLRKRIAELEAKHKVAFGLVRTLRRYCIYAHWYNPDIKDEFNEFDEEVCEYLSEYKEREE